MNLLIYEWKKIVTNRKYLSFLLLGLLLLVSNYGFNYFMSRQEVTRSNELLKSALYLPEKEQATRLDPEASLRLQQSEKALMIENNDYYHRHLEKDQKALDEFEEKHYRDYVEFHTYNKSFGLPAPQVGADYLINKPRTNAAVLAKGYPEESIRYGKTGVQFLTSLTPLLTSFIGVVFLLLAFDDVFATNLEQRKAQFILSQPVSRKRLLLADLVISFGNIAGFLVGISLLALFLGSLFGGFGYLDYPLLQGSVNPNATSFLPSWQYIVQVLLLFLLGLLFMLIVQSGIAMFTKNGYLSLTITLVLSFVLHRLNNTPLFTKWTQWSPFTYLEPSKLFIGGDYQPLWLESQLGNRNGATMQSIFIMENEAYYSGFNQMRYLGNPNLTFKTALIVLVLSNIIGWLIITKLFKRVVTIK